VDAKRKFAHWPCDFVTGRADGLTAKGYLRAGDRGNIRAIEAAINNLMFDYFK
jgi:hypothetical protein